ncbi:MAG: aldehyde ferredoxin oxidoreductase family protein [Thermodesulfobacteriota bacterium]
MKGIWNKVLRVDLSRGTCKAEKVPDEVYQYFLGGEGLGAYFMWRESPRGTLPFDPANCLTFGAGTLNGIQQSGADKWTTTAIAPSIYMNAGSAATASFGIEIKAAGYDAIVVTGRAEKPVYLVVDNDKAMLKDASHLWGKDAYEAEDAIHAAEGDNFEVASIGQAGERGVRFANIQTRKKSYCGRSGMGAIMGSKLLKAIAIRGTQELKYHDSAELNKLNREINRRLAILDSQKPEWLQTKRVGTAAATELFAPQGNLPISNYRLADWPDGVKAWHASNYARELNVKPWPCKYCVIQCHNLCEVKEGPYQFKGKGPEYESFAMMGFNTMCADIKAIAYACELADKYSMDTISLGVVIAWAMECYEKGVITKEDVYGLDLKWGNHEAVVELTKKIGLREGGLAYLLGEGCQYAAQRIGKGSEDWAVAMKGQEIAAHNWRAQYISALNYCTGVASGPNHERGNSQHIWVCNVRLPEWGIGEVENEERWSWKNAPERNAKFHDYCNVINSAGHCKFQEFSGYTLTDLTNTLNAACGLGWNTDNLRKCGERITTLQKILNIRYGWKKEHDFQYPKRFMEPVNEGPAAGKVPIGLDQAILDYYKVREWDPNGKPTPGLLERLGMEEYAANM